MFFFPLFLFPHELWSASAGTFSRAASKLNAVCRHATQERTGQAGICWLLLLWPKHLYTPQGFKAPKPRWKPQKNLFFLQIYSRIAHSLQSSQDINTSNSKVDHFNITDHQIRNGIMSIWMHTMLWIKVFQKQNSPKVLADLLNGTSQVWYPAWLVVPRHQTATYFSPEAGMNGGAGPLLAPWFIVLW